MCISGGFIFFIRICLPCSIWCVSVPHVILFHACKLLAGVGWSCILSISPLCDCDSVFVLICCCSVALSSVAPHWICSVSPLWFCLSGFLLCLVDMFFASLYILYSVLSPIGRLQFVVVGRLVLVVAHPFLVCLSSAQCEFTRRIS